jgi:hypothetical protein
MFFKVIACEILFRELCHLAAQTPHLLDLEFLTQGLHDSPRRGRSELQARIDAVPAGKYDAILVGYGLCGNIISGLTTAHTPLVIPRAHDCITFFLGSKERYQRQCQSSPGSYYYTSGWLECLRRRGQSASPMAMQFLPTPAGAPAAPDSVYAGWVQKYGAEEADYLRSVMGQWAESYSRGVLIDHDFAKGLRLEDPVQALCRQRGWEFARLDGDLRLLEAWLGGSWDEQRFLVVRPGHAVAPSYDDGVIKVG